ncbi:hypothetical protein JOD54_001810 [Actinokineospora baliensis]|uniref:DUF397 domain-containing protein n=1 Tax=Actinokineospora baliensis TaxID=547056 RepID=UPI0027DDA1A9|nr:DUF397 domain-containing protein [Actinokineospora baliensis]MBM7771606.1 hypothetical protein [Actinokineospora baliensis]
MISGIWRKSSRSGNMNACVELAVRVEVVGVRDSKNPAASALGFSRGAFDAMLIAIKAR